MSSLQDLHPYDSAIVGMNDVYIHDMAGKFYINSPCIMSFDHTLVTGSTYVLVSLADNPTINIRLVRFTDAYYDNELLNIFVSSIFSNTQDWLQLELRSDVFAFQWYLIDVDYLRARVKKIELDAFCEC